MPEALRIYVGEGGWGISQQLYLPGKTIIPILQIGRLRLGVHILSS